MAKKKECLTKLYSDKDEELLVRLISEAACYARLAQHCAWMMQYCCNGIQDLEIDCDRLNELGNRIFNSSSNLSSALQTIYNKNIDVSSRADKSNYVVQYLYDNTKGLDEIDAIIKDKARSLYEKAPLRSSDSRKGPVEFRKDISASGKLDDWFAVYGMTKEPKERKGE